MKVGKGPFSSQGTNLSCLTEEQQLVYIECNSFSEYHNKQTTFYLARKKVIVYSINKLTNKYENELYK